MSTLEFNKINDQIEELERKTTLIAQNYDVLSNRIRNIESSLSVKGSDCKFTVAPAENNVHIITLTDVTNVKDASLEWINLSKDNKNKIYYDTISIRLGIIYNKSTNYRNLALVTGMKVQEEVGAKTWNIWKFATIDELVSTILNYKNFNVLIPIDRILKSACNTIGDNSIPPKSEKFKENLELEYIAPIPEVFYDMIQENISNTIKSDTPQLFQRNSYIYDMIKIGAGLVCMKYLLIKYTNSFLLYKLIEYPSMQLQFMEATMDALIIRIKSAIIEYYKGGDQYD